MTGYYDAFDDDWQPDGTQPDGTQPDGMLLDGSQPDGTQPDGTQPDGSQPGGSRGDRDHELLTIVAAHTIASELFKRRDNFKPFWDLVQQECIARDSSFALSPAQCKDKYKYAKKGVSSVLAYHKGTGSGHIAGLMAYMAYMVYMAYIVELIKIARLRLANAGWSMQLERFWEVVVRIGAQAEMIPGHVEFDVVSLWIK
ncbi:hypothetical protein QJQ45_009966 [Haematococcus lacustris]|nr:hypothetical protein QJQ45_009966 [Haematococcus lacustris]